MACAGPPLGRHGLAPSRLDSPCGLGGLLTRGAASPGDGRIDSMSSGIGHPGKSWVSLHLSTIPCTIPRDSTKAERRRLARYIVPRHTAEFHRAITTPFDDGALCAS